MTNLARTANIRDDITELGSWFRIQSPQLSKPKRGQDDALQNVNQQIKHQDRIFVAFIPFEDRQYCYECFTTLSNFLDSLIHLHEDYVSKKSGVPIKLEKSDPESSSDTVQPHDEASASFDHNDYWDEYFKNLDTFFGTDIFREGNSYHHIDSEHQARTMFEALAKKKHDLPVRLRALAESLSFCAVCNMSFESQEAIKDHNAASHQDQLGTPEPVLQQEPASANVDIPVKEEQESTASEASWYCTSCDIAFSTQEEIDKHNVDHSNCVRFVSRRAKETHTCIACNRAFKSQVDIDKHNMRKHGPPPASPTSPVILQASVVSAYSCPFCVNMISKREEAVDRHIAKKHDTSKIANVVSAFACTVCGDIFPTKVDVARHGVSKHGVSSFILKTLETAALEDRHSDNLTCHTCDRVFASRSGLQDHNMSSHNPMACGCNETFPGLSSFRSHEKSCRGRPRLTRETMPPPEYFYTLVHQGPGLLPYDYSLDRSDYDSTEDSELDSEDDSEDDSECESEGVSECDSDVDTDGELGRVPCRLREYGCNEVFRSGSLLVYHYEHKNCCVDGLEITPEIFDQSEEKFENLVSNKYGIYKCPYCKNTGGGRFKYLHDLVKHAETNACRLRVRGGLISEVRRRLLEHVDYYDSHRILEKRI